MKMLSPLTLLTSSGPQRIDKLGVIHFTITWRKKKKVSIQNNIHIILNTRQ